ncbi:MAG: AbgT family transporter [Rikenellaceae bacterium]|nr:AbgT family transporter [Rikenellaceae bacterium]
MAQLKKIPHTFVIIGFLILFCGILTWFVPAGQFNYEKKDVNGVTREVIVNNSYHVVESSPQTWQIFGSLLEGFKKQAGIIAFVLIIGGAFQILNSSRAIDFGILSFLEKSGHLEKRWIFRKLGVNNMVIILSMTIFSLFGAIFGMSEETLAFVIIFVPLAISMGYDSITGIMMVYVAAHMGFSGAIINPFTIGIAQGLSGLQLFSGFEYRLIVWIILTTLIITVTLIYASKVKKNPRFSPMYELDEYWRNREMEAVKVDFATKTPISAWIVFAMTTIILVLFSIEHITTTISLGGANVTFVCLPVLTALFAITGFLTLRKSYLFFILNILGFTIVFLVVGVLGYGWYLSEISALFLAMGIISGIAMGSGANTIVKEFITGTKDILTAALIVGLAGGIIQVLTEGKIMDTILYSLSSTMEGTGKGATVSIMYFIQTCINIFIPSGSAKAALTMPIMAPFSDVIGLSRQATVMAFQFGDGFTNMITPTSAVLIGALGIARIPYEVWIKWFWKILLAFMILGLILLMPTVYMQLNGF